MNTRFHDILTTEDITKAFDLCCTRADVYKVISKIPERFGKFEIICVDEEYTYFVVQNLVNFCGKELTHLSTYEFRKIGGN